MRDEKICSKCQCQYCDVLWDDEDCNGHCRECNNEPVKNCKSFCGYVCNLE